jgi:hypothetical protein
MYVDPNEGRSSTLPGAPISFDTCLEIVHAKELNDRCSAASKPVRN